MEGSLLESRADWQGLFSKKFGYSQKRHINSNDQLGKELIGYNTLESLERRHYPEKSKSTLQT